LLKEKKQDEQMKSLEDELSIKQSQFECFQRELELAITPKIDERIKHEKLVWEQEQKYTLQKELVKLNEEKAKDIADIQKELTLEKEKSLKERENVTKLEKV
jgi:hypothetical protein